MFTDCSTISLLVIGFAMLMLASSSQMPKIMSRRDLRSLGTLVIVAGAVMLGAKMCTGKKAKYVLSPSPAYGSDEALESSLIDTNNVSLDCCSTSPYSTSTGCVCGAQEFVKSNECQEGNIAGQFPGPAINQSS